MTIDEYHQYLNASLSIGKLLLSNGAEIYRVEESIQHILNAYDIEKVDVFAIPTMIIVTIETKDYQSITKTQRIYTRGTNFDRIIILNDYIRYICDMKPDLNEILEHIASIKKRPIYGIYKHLSSASLVGFAFTLFFNGNFFDALVASFAVFIARYVNIEMEKHHVNSFFITLVASFIHTTIASIFVIIVPVLQADKIIMGTLMILVPGVAFTTALRDIIAKDLLAGILAGIEALLIATAIAIGSAMSYWIIAESWKIII